MVWDPRSSHFVMFCATDNPRAGEHRIARPAPYRTVWPSPGPDGSLSLVDVVLASALLGLGLSFRMMRLPDPTPSESTEGMAFG